MNERISSEVKELARFWAKVNKDGPVPAHRPELGACWVWTKTCNNKGYSQFRFEGRLWLGHRLVYANRPRDKVLDHLCRNHACVRPSHLEPVTNRENVMRGILPQVAGAHNRVKTHCRNGHEFAGDNLYVRSNGERECRICRKAYNHAHYLRRAA